jgi:hypothetical protein
MIKALIQGTLGGVVALILFFAGMNIIVPAIWSSPSLTHFVAFALPAVLTAIVLKGKGIKQFMVSFGAAAMILVLGYVLITHSWIRTPLDNLGLAAVIVFFDYLAGVVLGTLIAFFVTLARRNRNN